MSQHVKCELSAIDKLFGEMMLLYGRAWSSQFPAEREHYANAMAAIRAVWYRELQAFSHEQIQQALCRYKKSDAGKVFPPSPLRLAELCITPLDELGIPESRVAFNLAVKRDYAHPAIYHAAMDVGAYEMRTLAEKEAYARFEGAYKRRCEQVRQGVELSLPKFQALPESVDALATEHVRLKHLSAIKNLLRR